MQEEAGITVKVDKFLDERFVENSDTIIKWYLCHPNTHELRAGDDLAEVKYVPRSDVPRVCDPAAVSRWPPKVVEYFGV